MDKIQPRRFIAATGCFLALMLSATASDASPDPPGESVKKIVRNMVPSGGTNDYDFGVGFTRVDEVRMDWAGEITPGICENGGVQFECTSEWHAWNRGENFISWNAYSSGPVFDLETKFLPQTSASRYYLRDGVGELYISLTSPEPYGNIVVPPDAYLSRVKIVIEGIRASVSCGDGTLDPLEFCDDGGLIDGDGCDHLCVVEPFFLCEGEPSTCTGTEFGGREILDTGILGRAVRAVQDVAVDASGNAYMAVPYEDFVVRVTPEGVASIFLDVLSMPTGLRPSFLAIDGADNLFIAESFSSFDEVYRHEPDGTMTMVIDETGDGGANPLGSPSGIALDGLGNLYVSGESIVFKVTPEGVKSVVIDGTGDGITALVATTKPAVDALGNVYVAGVTSNNVFRITPTGVITEVIDATGNGSGFPLDRPKALALAADGALYVADWDRVLELGPDGVITEVLGPDGDGDCNPLERPYALEIGPAGRLYVAGFVSDNVFEVDLPGDRSVRVILDDQGDLLGSGLESPVSITVPEVGLVYVAGWNSWNSFRITMDLPPLAQAAAPGLSRLSMAFLAAALSSLGWLLGRGFLARAAG